MHTPPFLQGALEHLSAICWQNFPVKPFGHVHLYCEFKFLKFLKLFDHIKNLNYEKS